MSAIAWGRLLRVSLAPSAAADALAGITVGAWGAFPLDARAALMPLASLCVFHGGMALNDWADREGDARTRPDRPIPSGAVPAASALRAAVALLVLGPLLAVIASPGAGAVLGAVALTAASYDLAGRGAWLGPTLLGLCRGGNLAAGVVAGNALAGDGGSGLPRWAWVACGVYALYVFFASRLARLEDDEDQTELGAKPARYLLAAGACLALTPLTVLAARGPMSRGSAFAGSETEEVVVIGWALLGLPWLAATPLAWTSAWLLARAVREPGAWTRARVGRAAGMSLRRLLICTTVFAWIAPLGAARAGVVDTRPAFAAYLVAPALLLGYPIALRLRRVFPPT